MIIPSEQFSFRNKRFVAECSDLIGFGFRNNIPQMFGIRGLQRVEQFRFDHLIKNRDEEIEVWVFVSVNTKLGLEVHILND